MIRTPPRSNRTDPLFPYTTRFRSLSGSLARTPAETSLGRPYRILLVEDDRGDALLVAVALEETLPGAALIWHPTVPSETEVLSAHPDCILVDLGLPGLSGLEALAAMLERADGAPVVVLTGLHDRETGVSAVARGAADSVGRAHV